MILPKLQRACLLFLILFSICFAALNQAALAQLETRINIPGVDYPFSVAVGDFNKDGKLDFVTASSSLQLFLGKGDGTFLPPIDYLVGTSVYDVVVADLNHDGNLDVVAANNYGLVVLLGNGDGTFQAPVYYKTGCNVPDYIQIGDVNGDNRLDLIMSYDYGGCEFISVLLGNGDGTFREPVINSPMPYIGPIAVGDFNRDGKLDAVVVSGNVIPGQILLGNGDGTFSYGATFDATSLEGVSVADLRGNGILDIVATAYFNGASVSLGNGDGTFGSAVVYPAQWSIIQSVADFNGDGIPDVAMGVVGEPGVYVLLGNGDGTLQTAVPLYCAGLVRALAGGDFNGDGLNDLMVTDYGFSAVDILLSTGVVNFSPTSPVRFPAQLLGTTSPPQTVTLTNTGNTALLIDLIRTDGPFQETNTCGKQVPAGAACQISVTFAPEVKGLLGGDIYFRDSASSKPQIVELSGGGTVISLSPTSLAFPGQKIGTQSPPQTVTITNMGTSAVTMNDISLVGPNDNNFSFTQKCPALLNAGASCTVDVTFVPRRVGPRTATLEVDDNGGGSPQTVSLLGKGQRSAP